MSTKKKAPQERKRRGRPRKATTLPLSKQRPVKRTALTPKAGAPLEWWSKRYAQLLQGYAELLIKKRMNRSDALQFLAVVFDIGRWRDPTITGRNPKKVEARITEARADAKKFGWGAHLPEWAQPVLSPRFKANPD